MDDLYYSAVDLLKKLICVPSFSKEEHAVADILQEYINSYGLKVNRVKNNLWVKNTCFDNSKPTILLNSHIDTVKPVSGWTKDPFMPEVISEQLFGLGSNDAGASLVCLLHTFIALNERVLDYNLVFLASAEEEISGKDGMEFVLNEIPQPAFAIVGEPTNMNPAIAEKGLMVLDCVAHGKSGHAARYEGENAIYNAMQDIEWFRTYKFPEISGLLGEVKMTVTMINAGTQHNVIPDRCEFVVDVRSNELYPNKQLFDIIDKHTKSDIKARSFRLNSSNIAVENPFIQRLIMMGKIPFGSPTLSDQALMGFPSVKIGPGDSSRSHTADEFILLSEIREALEYYYKALDGLRI